MAFEVELINVSPTGARSVALDGDRIAVERDGILKVTPEQAGKAPHWRRATDADELTLRNNPMALHWRLRAGDIEVYDLGSGLLAQPEHWRLASDPDTDPADPLADGHGGVLDPAAQATALAEVFRAADNLTEHDAHDEEQS